ncbi:MAG: RDD family protein [Solirubrobacterales bacterium]|nr:RDD family protein [Solirubrobacterales bacterium]
MEDYQDRLRLTTPEGVEVDLILGGLGSRFTATMVDLVLKALLILGVTLLASQLGVAGLVVMSIAGFAIYFGYDVLFEVLAGGRTPGKRWTGLRVLRDDGRPVDLLSSCVRNVVRLVDGLPLSYLPAMISVLLTRKHQRLGDLAAGTIVVREPKAPKREAQAEPQAAFAPRGLALDVSAVTSEDLATVRSFLERRPQLDPAIRDDLARRIASALRPKVGGGVDGLGAEQLLEQVASAKARGF